MSAPAPAAEPEMVTMAFDGLELAGAAAAIGSPPWSPLVRRVIAVTDPRGVTAVTSAEALVRLVDRGLVRSGPSDDGDLPLVELHPALVVLLAMLAEATVLIEAEGDAATHPVRSCLFVPGVGAVIVDREGDEQLLFTVSNRPVDPDQAIAVLVEHGHVRIFGRDGTLLAEVVPGAPRADAVTAIRAASDAAAAEQATPPE